MPVMRAMALAFQDDISTFDKDFQFLLGPWLLVAPIYTENNARTVYLPAGEWIDFWTLEHHTGPKTLNIQSSLDTLPLYVRAGAIVPMMGKTERIPDALIDPMILEIYPWNQSSYELHEDEGSSRVVCDSDPKRIEITIDGKVERSWILRVKQVAKNVRVAAQSQIDRTIVSTVAYHELSKTCEISLGTTSYVRLTIDHA